MEKGSRRRTHVLEKKEKEEANAGTTKKKKRSKMG